MDCRKASHFCVAALKQKQRTHLLQEDLRNQTAKKILLNFEVTYVRNRPNSYISKRKRLSKKILIFHFYLAFLNFFVAFNVVAMVSMINKIANMHPSVPGLLQDDSHVPYCNADKLPAHSDKDIPTGDRVYYCPHMIQLELGELYEITLLDDKCKYTIYASRSFRFFF